MNTLLVITLSVMGSMLALTLLNPVLPKWFCKYMGWHLAPKSQGFDGCSSTGMCPRCGKAVLQDSQGNWF